MHGTFAAAHRVKVELFRAWSSHAARCLLIASKAPVMSAGVTRHLTRNCPSRRAARTEARRLVTILDLSGPCGSRLARSQRLNLATSRLQLMFTRPSPVSLAIGNWCCSARLRPNGSDCSGRGWRIGRHSTTVRVVPSVSFVTGRTADSARVCGHRRGRWYRHHGAISRSRLSGRPPCW